MTFNAPNGIILTLLAGNTAFIIPADIAEAAGEDQLTYEQSIGTGPFKFAEHEADRHLRLVRSVVLGVAEGQYVEAANSIGASRARILFRHIAINSLSPAIVQTSIVFAQSIHSEASLSFLGAGIPTHVPSWGVMLADSRVFLATAPWTMLVPGAALTITVFALNLIGDGIRDMLDPRLRNR